MKYFFLFIALSACAHKPAMNEATLNQPDSEAKEKLSGLQPMTAQYEFEGYRVAAKQCSFLRTMYLDLTPVQTGAMKRALDKRIEPKTIMGMDHVKQKGKMNPCSRLRYFKTLKDINLQGTKPNFSDKGFLVKANFGEAPDGQAFLQIEFFEKKKKEETVRVANPGYFLSDEKVSEMTNDEIADWIVTTLYHIGWK